jgi:hypothetical protein
MYSGRPRTKAPVSQDKQVYFQGSRQISNFSRRYYEHELGAGIGPSPSMKEHFGYTEPFRRFVQRESFSPQANAIPNTMPSWLSGDDYLTNFHLGDPYIKVDEGYARLPGAGYGALHPELKGVDPNDYPDIHKLAILADVAPYSREYNIFRSKVGADSTDNTELRIEYEKILDRVRQTRESVIKMDNYPSPSLRPIRHHPDPLQSHAHRWLPFAGSIPTYSLPALARSSLILICPGNPASAVQNCATPAICPFQPSKTAPPGIGITSANCAT